MKAKGICTRKSFVLPWAALLCFSLILPLTVMAGVAAAADTTDTDTDTGTGVDPYAKRAKGEYEPGCGHLRGFIYKSDDETPLWGAQVVLQEMETRRLFRSNVTDSTGDFELFDIPAGNYVVLILSRNKAYKVKQLDFLIKIIAGKTTTISFSLKKSTGGFFFFLIEPCCDAAVISGTALAAALIKKFTGLKDEEEQSPTRR